MAIHILDALKTIQVAFNAPIGLSGTVMIQNDVKRCIFPENDTCETLVVELCRRFKITTFLLL